MDHIVSVIQPFVAQQTVSVYVAGECVKTVQCPLDFLEDTITALSKSYSINEVDLAGNEIFTRKIRDDLHVRPKFAKFGLHVTIH